MTLQEFTNRYQYNPSTDKLGAGGFGQVYKAYDTVLDREFALKMAQVIEGKENLSLLKEVELAKNLPVHANVAHYQDCFRLNFPNGTYDIGILQYYPEGSLATIIKKGQLSLDQIQDLTRGILEGLAFLHGHNVMHRDMKPGNVLISKRGDKYIPKIADFGLSKQVDSFENSSFVNSFAGGSAYYWAPEQLTGDKVRQNVDLWSFGVMLYELVTGDRPFTATMTKSETEDARLEIYGKIKRGDIPAKIGSVAEPYQTIIKSCLIPDRTQRIQNATDLISMLDGKIPRGFDPEATVVQDNTSMGNPPPLPNEEEWPKEPFTRSSTTQVKQKPKAEKKRAAKPSNQPEKKQRSLVLPIVLLLVSLLACAGAYYYFEVYDSKLSEQELWIQALENKDVASYQAILDAYPDGQYAIQARTVVDSLESITATQLAAESAAWTAAEDANSISGYQNFISAYPESTHLATAQEQVTTLESQQSTAEAAAAKQAAEAEDNYWARCERTNDMDLYQDYLNKYPAGKYVSQAASRLTDLRGSAEAEEQRLADETNMQSQRDAEAQRQREADAQAAANAIPSELREIAQNMVRVSGGTFSMGSNKDSSTESPVHEVTLPSFQISKYEVTQAQWDEVMGTNVTEPSGCDRCPVDKVSWSEVQNFIIALNRKSNQRYRLPTEAEWEYAARGGNSSNDYQYSGSNDIDNVAWYDENSGNRMHKVGQKNSNELGLYDMSGNVLEWCSDWYGSGYYGNSPKINPKGPKNGSYRSARGGSRVFSYHDGRVTNRLYYNLDGGSGLGFRLASE